MDYRRAEVRDIRKRSYASGALGVISGSLGSEKNKTRLAVRYAIDPLNALLISRQSIAPAKPGDADRMAFPGRRAARQSRAWRAISPGGEYDTDRRFISILYSISA